MATWEDGPEYAPVARPDHFAAASAAPLSPAPPPGPSGPAVPAQRPRFDTPTAPVAALETLVPPVEQQRDPTVPFEVAASTMTEATSAWSAAHWSRPAEPPAPEEVAGSYVQPIGWPAPSYPSPPPPGLPVPTPPGGFPAPGTTQWFAPPPPLPAPRYPGPIGVAAIMACLTPGVIICLLIGGLVWPLAPITFALAFALTFQMKAGRRLTRTIFGIASALLGFVLLIGILTGEGVFGDWWELLARWAQVISWIMLVVSWIVVYRELRTSGTGAGRGNWG